MHLQSSYFISTLLNGRDHRDCALNRKDRSLCQKYWHSTWRTHFDFENFNFEGFDYFSHGRSKVDRGYVCL